VPEGAGLTPGWCRRNPGSRSRCRTRWAAETAPLLGIPEPALIGYGTGDLAMQDRAPGCRLSWIALPALGHVGSEQVRPQDGVPAALATAETLCASGHDTATEAGWGLGEVGDASGADPAAGGELLERRRWGNSADSAAM
jgi:hypothetical protein